MGLKLKQGNTLITRILDSDTGGVLDQNIDVVEFVIEIDTHFVAFYSEMLGAMMKLDGSECRVLGYLAYHYSNGTPISASKDFRRVVARETNLNERTVYRTIRQLHKKEILIKEKQGMIFYVNPELAFKGGSDKRKAAFFKIVQRTGYGSDTKPKEEKSQTLLQPNKEFDSEQSQ